MTTYWKLARRALALIGLVGLLGWALLLVYALWRDPTSLRAWLKLLTAIGLSLWLYEDVLQRPAEEDAAAEAETPSPKPDMSA